MPTMDVLIVWLAVGAVSGWIAGKVMTGHGFGVIGDMIVGIVGSLIAGYLLPKFGIILPVGITGYVISSAFGGIVFLLALSILRQIF